MAATTLESLKDPSSTLTHLIVTASEYKMAIKVRKRIKQALKLARKVVTYAPLRFYANITSDQLAKFRAEFLQARESFSGDSFSEFSERKGTQVLPKVKADVAAFNQTLNATESKLFDASIFMELDSPFHLRATRLAKRFQLYFSATDPYVAAVNGFAAREEYLAGLEDTRDQLKKRIEDLKDKEAELSRRWFKSREEQSKLLDVVLLKETLKLVLFWDRFNRQYDLEHGEEHLTATRHQKLSHYMQGGIMNEYGFCAVNAATVAILNLRNFGHLVANKTDPVSLAFRKMRGSSLLDQMFNIDPLRDVIDGLKQTRGAKGGSHAHLVFHELVEKWGGLREATLGTATFGGKSVKTSVQILMKVSSEQVSLDELIALNEFRLIEPPRVLVLSLWLWPTAFVGRAFLPAPKRAKYVPGDVQRVLDLLPYKEILQKCEKSLLAFIISDSSMMYKLQTFCDSCLKKTFNISIDLNIDSFLVVARKLEPLTGRYGASIVQEMEGRTLTPEVHDHGDFKVEYSSRLQLNGFNYTLRATTEDNPAHTYTIAWLDEGCFEVNDYFRRQVQCVARDTTSVLYYELDEPAPVLNTCNATEVLDKQLNECMDRSLLDSFIKGGKDHKKTQSSVEYFGKTTLYDELVQLGGANLNEDERVHLKKILADLSQMAQNEAVALKVPLRKRKASRPIQLLKKLQLLDIDERKTFFQVVGEDALKKIDWQAVSSICYEQDNCALLGCEPNFIRGKDGKCVKVSLIQRWAPTAALGVAGAGIAATLLVPKLLRSRSVGKPPVRKNTTIVEEASERRHGKIKAEQPKQSNILLYALILFLLLIVAGVAFLFFRLLR